MFLEAAFLFHYCMCQARTLVEFFFSDFIYLCFMCMCILPGCMSVHHVCPMSKEARRRHQILLELELQIDDNMSVLGIEPRALGRKSGLTRMKTLEWFVCSLLAHSPQRTISSRFMNLLFSYVVHWGQITT